MVRVSLLHPKHESILNAIISPACTLVVQVDKLESLATFAVDRVGFSVPVIELDIVGNAPDAFHTSITTDPDGAPTKDHPVIVQAKGIVRYCFMPVVITEPAPSIETPKLPTELPAQAEELAAILDKALEAASLAPATAANALEAASLAEAMASGSKLADLYPAIISLP